MLITRRLMSKVEKYFIKNPKNIDFSADYDERFCKVVNKVIKTYRNNPEKSRFIEMCLFKQMSWNNKVYETLHIERRTFFTWKEEILSDAVICAALDGLISLDTNNFTEN